MLFSIDFNIGPSESCIEQYGKQEFWRLANQSSDTILDIQVLYDGTPQMLMLVALDGVPVGSQEGARHRDRWMLRRRLFRLAVTIESAAGFRATSHKVLVAGDAAAKNKLANINDGRQRFAKVLRTALSKNTNFEQVDVAGRESLA